MRFEAEIKTRDKARVKSYARGRGEAEEKESMHVCMRMRASTLSLQLGKFTSGFRRLFHELGLFFEGNGTIQ